MGIFDQINKDLEESRIDWKVAIAFVPITIFTYFFHEFGHWLFGELTGNEMTIGLNNASPKNGAFNTENAALLSAIGGPLFTIFQALIFAIATAWTKSVYAYSFAFQATYSRFFSIVFGGIGWQDESRIAALLNTSPYFVASVVISMLFLMLWISSKKMGFNAKAAGYFTVLGTLGMLLVIAMNALSP